jgi:hypothetical protein
MFPVPQGEGLVMVAQFVVELTEVRPLPQWQIRDERSNPESVLEAFPVTEPVAAHALFTGLCQLSEVRAGRHRARIVPLGGSDTAACPRIWGAPLSAHTSAGSVAGGVR